MKFQNNDFLSSFFYFRLFFFFLLCCFLVRDNLGFLFPVYVLLLLTQPVKTSPLKSPTHSLLSGIPCWKDLFSQLVPECLLSPFKGCYLLVYQNLHFERCNAEAL